VAVQTEAELCNIALGRCGIRDYIDDLDEASDEAEACSRHYPNARDSVLASAPWKFATRRADLNQLTNVTRTGWGFCYSLPADFVSPVRLWPQPTAGGGAFMTSGSPFAGYSMNSTVRALGSDQKIPYDIESDVSVGTGRILVTDLDQANLQYVARITTPALFSDLFVNAVAWQLAIELCMALAIKPAVAQGIERKAYLAIGQAVAAEFRMAQADSEPESQLIRARY
jgi:hypothetical protein